MCGECVYLNHSVCAVKPNDIETGSAKSTSTPPEARTSVMIIESHILADMLLAMCEMYDGIEQLRFG